MRQDFDTTSTTPYIAGKDTHLELSEDPANPFYVMSSMHRRNSN